MMATEMQLLMGIGDKPPDAQAISGSPNLTAGLTARVQAVYRAVPNRYGMPQQHDVIDPHFRLRRFAYSGTYYVAKAVSTQTAHLERAAAVAAADRLDNAQVGVFKLVVLVPDLVQIDDGRTVLVARDLGAPIPATPGGAAGLELVMSGLAKLLVARGVEWRGFAPRNLIIDQGAQCLWLIDLEGAILHAGVAAALSRTILLKWRLNWRQAFTAGGPLERAILAIPRRPGVTSDLDAFERCLLNTVEWTGDLDTLLDYADAATLEAEVPLAGLPPGRLSAFAIGHYLDEVLPPPVSVLVTFLCARLRRLDANGATAMYSKLSLAIRAIPPGRCAERVPDLILPILDATIALGTGKGPHSFSNLLASLMSLRDEQGWSAAITRAVILGRICAAAYVCVTEAFPFLPKCDLVLRGSVGQGLASRQSDVDFEISSVAFPGGRPGLEALIASLLGLFGISAEGSRARPTEPDLVGEHGHRRDANEWSQLRDPATDERPLWLEGLFPQARDGWWTDLSLFELAQPRAALDTPSYRFKCVRAALARAAAKAGCHSPLAERQWDAVCLTLPSPLVLLLRRLLDQALADRDGLGLAAAANPSFAVALGAFCQAVGIPDPVAAAR
jgi:hypothetical protein